MVYYYKTKDGHIIYMGKHKEENEDLIKYGFPEDVWFHVDNYSSAHVYLRLKDGENLDNIPEDVLTDCCQLVKQNSIEGCKLNNLTIIYTMWSNLRKDGSMAVGQVGFRDNKAVRKCKVEKKLNEIVNRLEKTCEEKFPDLKQMREDRDKEERNARKAALKAQEEQERREREEKQKEAEIRSYAGFMDPSLMKSNKEITQDYRKYEEDFM